MVLSKVKAKQERKTRWEKFRVQKWWLMWKCKENDRRKCEIYDI